MSPSAASSRPSSLLHPGVARNPASSTSHTSNTSHTSHTSHTSLPYVPVQPESLILPDGPVGEDDAELLDELVHHHNHGRRDTHDTLVDGDNDDGDGEGEEEDEHAQRRKLPWWKRASPYWILAMMPISSIATSSTITPRIEVYTMLACSVHKPDIFKQNFPGVELGLQGLFSAPSATTSDVNQYQYHQSTDLTYTRYNSTTPTLSQARNLISSTSTNEDADTPPILEIPIYIPADGSASYPADGPTPADGDKEPPATPPPKRNQCAADPVVQAAVAKLTAVIAGIMGVLSCITTGWWGAFSDRHGRTRVMGLSVLGLLFTDINFIFVALCSKHIPGGYWFLVVAPFIEGGLGGITAGVAALHAYMADTTEENVRSRNFSLGLGLMFSGMALGPTVGSLLIRATGHTLSVFYLATYVHFLYTFLVWFILPESLTRKQMSAAKERYAREAQAGVQGVETSNDGAASWDVKILARLRRLFAFLSPLTVFMPAEVKGQGVNVNPLKKPKKDWNLTFLALAYGAIISIAGSYSYKFQYAAATFGWSAEELGYWLSFMGITRAVFLTFVLPLAIKILKPKPIVIEIPVQSSTIPSDNETSPLLADSSASDGTQATPKTIKKEIHSPSFDFKLLHFSVIIELLAYIPMAFSVRPLPFTMFAALGSLGAGFSPAMQSVALALYTSAGGTEVGRLFGALAVVQALSMQIFGPALYGIIYVKTVAFFPRAIFFLTVLSVFASYVFINLVRLPKDSELRRRGTLDLEEDGANGTGVHVQEETLVAVDASPIGASESQESRLVDTPAKSYGTA